MRDEWQSPVIQGNLGLSYDLGDSFSLHVNSGLGQLKPREGALDTALNVPANETRLKLDLGLLKHWERGGKLAITPFYTRQFNAIEYNGGTYEHPVTGQILELYENREQDQLGLELMKEANLGWALWSFKGRVFGLLNNNRKDVQYENWHGHRLDRDVLELLQAY